MSTRKRFREDDDDSHGEQPKMEAVGELKKPPDDAGKGPSVDGTKRQPLPSFCDIMTLGTVAARTLSFLLTTDGAFALRAGSCQSIEKVVTWQKIVQECVLWKEEQKGERGRTPYCWRRSIERKLLDKLLKRYDVAFVHAFLKNGAPRTRTDFDSKLDHFESESRSLDLSEQKSMLPTLKAIVSA
ncbi:MAG: hypothetical protein SGARI_004372, partial [Bacillariaceae sp.]